ncbi:MAG TPA: PAS domain S-box protein [Azonexus sp.]|nr:PAS domain S-box protein [Azonexus sp.]
MLVVALLLFAAETAYHLYQTRNMIEQDAIGRLENHSLVLKEAVERHLTAINASLLHVRATAPARMADKAGRAALGHELRDLLNILQTVRTLAVLDADGTAIASSRPELEGQSFARREYFAALKKRPLPDRLHVSPPFTTVTGVYTLNVVRPIYDRQGAFVGIVSATLDVVNLGKLIEAMHPTEDTRLSINYGDGTLLVLVPESANAKPGSDVNKPGTFFRRHVDSGQPQSLMQGVSGMLGKDSILSMRTLQPAELAMDAPLMITAARNREDILAPWHAQLYWRSALFALVAAVLTIALRLYQRQIGRAHDALAALIDAFPDGVAVRNRAGEIVLSNEQARAMLGAETLAERLRALVDGADPQQAEIQFVDAAGTRRWAELLSAPLAWDGAPAIAVSIRDITERKLGEEQLGKLAKAVDQSPESIVFTDLDGKIEYVNAAFLSITGYSWDEVIGQNPRMLQSGQTPPERYREMWATLSAGRPWRGELINRRKDGSTYLEQASIVPIRQADGRITHYVAVKLDVTELRRNERELAAYRDGLERLVGERTTELAAAKEAAESANQAKSSFLANMSHEIRTPMNAILGLTYVLLQGDLPADQADKVHKVAGAANHLLQILNDILDLSKIEAGKLQLEEMPFSPGEVIHSVASMIRDRAAGKGLTLNVDAEALPWSLLGDEMRLRQVLLNFASNALKFTEQGSITMTGQVLSEQDGMVECRFSVSDTGIGIMAGQIERLFRPFEQLDNSTTRRYGGTGLGLVIARHLARLMGGDVGVDSTKGVGSTFWITTRLRRAAVQPRPAATGPGDGLRMLGRVLLAEDEPTNREIGCILLNKVGLDVVAVGDGAAAVEEVKKGGIDLVLMDLQMPVMDGLAATRWIRALPQGGHVPIVALTANAFPADRERCLQVGMDDFLAKPVDPEALYATLARYLQVVVPLRGGATRPEPPVPDIDAAELAAGLRAVQALLATGNSQAGRQFEKIRAAIRLRFPAESRQLSRRIELYDFEPALALVDDLLSRLAEKPAA